MAELPKQAAGGLLFEADGVQLEIIKTGFMNPYDKIAMNFLEKGIEVTEVLLTQSRVRAYDVTNFLDKTMYFDNTGVNSRTKTVKHCTIFIMACSTCAESSISRRGTGSVACWSTPALAMAGLGKSRVSIL